MAVFKNSYEEIDDFFSIAIRLINKYPEIFPGVDPKEFVSNIKCVGINNKSRKDEEEYFDVKGVAQPIRMFCEVSYIAVVYLRDWINLDSKHKAILVQKILSRIPLDSQEEGRVLS